MKIWTCKIVLPDDAELPWGADQPPRRAVIEAVAQMTKSPQLACFSGWGGELSDGEAKYLDHKLKAFQKSSTSVGEDASGHS